MVTKGEGGEGINWEFRVNRCTLLYMCYAVLSHSAASESVQTHGLYTK